MSKPTEPINEFEHHAADRATTRPVVSGTQGVVSAGHPLVSMAGMRMLLSGGNAFDAAVAAGFAAAVVEPTASYTLCGECVALIHDARKRESVAVSGQGTAPALATLAFFRGRGLDRIPTGPGPDAHLSFTVPGAVDAYLTVLETHGTKTVSEVLAPALHYAERGFPMYEYMQRLLAIPESRSQFDIYPPGGTAVFYPGGRVPDVGDLFVQEALAGTLRRLVEADGRGRGHRAAGIAAARARFYRGDIAASIGAFSERLGGLLRASDLAGYRARLEPPLRTTVAGRPTKPRRRVTRRGGGAARLRGCRPRGGRRRDDAHRGHRSRRQHDLSDAERWRVQKVGVRSGARLHAQHAERNVRPRGGAPECARPGQAAAHHARRSEEHTSELQSLAYLVCRLLLEKKKKRTAHKSLSYLPCHAYNKKTTLLHTKSVAYLQNY